jgi:hypothetical protein
MIARLLSYLSCWHCWDLVAEADLDDVRTCEKCGTQHVLQVDGWSPIGR